MLLRTVGDDTQVGVLFGSPCSTVCSDLGYPRGRRQFPSVSPLSPSLIYETSQNHPPTTPLPVLKCLITFSTLATAVMLNIVPCSCHSSADMRGAAGSVSSTGKTGLGVHSYTSPERKEQDDEKLSLSSVLGDVRTPLSNKLSYGSFSPPMGQQVMAAPGQ